MDGVLTGVGLGFRRVRFSVERFQRCSAPRRERRCGWDVSEHGESNGGDGGMDYMAAACRGAAEAHICCSTAQAIPVSRASDWCGVFAEELEEREGLYRWVKTWTRG
jgi:hypothetical protein